MNCVNESFCTDRCWQGNMNAFAYLSTLVCVSVSYFLLFATDERSTYMKYSMYIC